jgi:large subunit ribosomal protein L4
VSMQLPVKNLEAQEVGTIELDDAIFGVEVRPDILQRVVVWQLAKRRAGTHKVKTRGEVNRTGAKMYKQKGTGRARHGSRRVNIFRGGGVAFGPVVRSHAIDLPKKVRALGLKCALSAKAKEGKLVVVDALRIDEPRTKRVQAALERLGIGSALMIAGKEVDRNFALGARNLPGIDVLPVQGANVYDILRRDTLVLTTEAVHGLAERLA